METRQILDKAYQKHTFTPHAATPTIDAGIVTDLVDDTGEAPRFANRAAIALKNTGSNTIKYAVYEHPDPNAAFVPATGGDWFVRVSSATLTAGSSILLKLDPINPLNVKIVVEPNVAGVQSDFDLSYELSR